MVHHVSATNRRISDKESDRRSSGKESSSRISDIKKRGVGFFACSLVVSRRELCCRGYYMYSRNISN